MTIATLAAIESTHLPIILIIGLAIFFGTIGARIFQYLRIPQVVGYIAIGLLVGQSGFQLISEDAIRNLLPFNFFALGIIGFMIGGELHRDVFKKYGRQLIAILLGEGLGAFLMVSLVTGGIAWAVTGQAGSSIALGIVLGAISSATAPAATSNVLWETKARGPLTTSLFAIVAMDDSLAVALYAVAFSIATKLIGQVSGGLLQALGHSFYELAGAVVLGVAAGFLLNFILRRARDHDKAMAFIIGSLALVIGLALVGKVDLILAAMALGVTLTNLAPRRSHVAFELVETFAPPIYVLFFVIVGARLNVQAMPLWMWAIAVAYVVARSAGKIAGASLGGHLGHATITVRKYLGLSLFSQAGVAVGLSILAADRLPAEIGVPIITIIAATTFLLEILGPPFVKFAVKRAGEAGLNVTEEDLMRLYRAGDMMDRTSPTFLEGTPLANILRTISETDAMSYPVVDADRKLVGIITIQDLKRSFSAEGMTEWLVAFDLMQPVPDTVTKDTPLEEAVSRMEQQQLEYLPVVAAKDDPRLLGLLELWAVTRKLSEEVLRKHRRADTGLA